MKCVTTGDIAKMLGVSRPTVSSVLSGSKTNTAVSEALRERIVKKAAVMGYRANAAASAVRLGRFNNIALVVGKGITTSTLPQTLLFRLADGLSARGYQLAVARLSDATLTDERELPIFLRQHACDGLLLNYTHRVPMGVRELIDRHRIPSIWLNVKQDHDCVHPDDFDAALRATRWLIARGHRRIAYLGSARTAWSTAEQHYSIADRLAGYARAMSEAGLASSFPISSDLEAGEANVTAIAALLRKSKRPTAIVAYGGGESAAYVAALRLGLSVPNDLELVGFGDHVTMVGGLPLPTMRIALSQVAVAAVTAILAKIDAPSTPQPAIAVPYDPEPVTDDYATVTIRSGFVVAEGGPTSASPRARRDPGPGSATRKPRGS